MCGPQLRDLVPPQQKESANASQDNLDPTKRPKHVVLSDTILLVKSLADKVPHLLLSPIAFALMPCHAMPLASKHSISSHVLAFKQYLQERSMVNACLHIDAWNEHAGV